jgi:ubiquinone/menaquinone biosynthesis C-methylase UbiE
MGHRVEQAQRTHPTISWHVGSADELPYGDATFDLVMSSVVFSSILSEPLRQDIVDEMWRILKPEGLILFHDFTHSNPRNTAVQGVTYKRVKQLFDRSGVRFDFRRMVLAPPVSRIVAPHAYWLAYMLEQLQVFNTHIIGIISRHEVN